MFKLKGLRIRRFLSILDVDIDFSKPGLYLINGYNSIGGDSNGCGKSATLAAISVALWGRTPSGLRGNDVTTWGYDDSGYNIELTLTDGKEDYIITRSPTSLSFTIGGRDMGGRKTDIQEIINNTFHSSYGLFFASTFFTSSATEYLTSMTDSDKKKLFKDIIGLESLDQAYTKAKGQYDSYMAAASGLAQQVDTLEGYLSSRQKEKARHEQSYTKFEDDRDEKIDELRAQIKTPPKVNTTLLFDAKHIEIELNKKLQAAPKIREFLEKLDTKLMGYYEDLGNVRGTIATLEHDLDEALSLGGATVCDKCGGRLEINYEEHLKHLKNDLQQARSKEFYLLEEISKTNDEQKQTQSTLDGIQELQNKLDNLTAQLDEEALVQKEWQSLSSSIQSRIADLTTTTNPYAELIEASNIDLQENAERYAESKRNLALISHKIDLLAFMKIVFSKEGAASHIIETAFGRLESLANRYLTKICSERFLISIKPQRELKSKAFKEEIDIFVYSSGQKKMLFKAMSGGQQQRVNIAMLMALYRYCRDLGKNSFDFIILDEVLDLSLGVKGQSDVMGLMRDMLQEVAQVLVISHKDGISQEFDYEITLRRESDGFTRLVP